MTRPVFDPKLEILPAPQQQLWHELAGIPPEFILYGGTAIALHLGHRQSVDFDFFGDRSFDPDRLAAAVPFMAEARIIQKAADTLTGIVERGGPVQVSFFGLPGIPRLAEPLVAPGNGLKVASLLDLAAMKVAVVQKRAEAKDYIDLHAMLDAGVIDLPTALSAGKGVYGASFNPQITLKALTYFGEDNLRRLPEAIKARLVEEAAAVDLDRLPELDPRPAPDHGHAP